VLTLIINREVDTDRLASIMPTVLKQPELEPQVVVAIDGYAPDFTPPADIEAGNWSGSPGTIACSLSHRLAWRALLESDEPYALITEDDSRMHPGFDAFLKDLADLQGFDIVFVNRRMVMHRERTADTPDRFREVGEVYNALRDQLGERAEHANYGGVLPAAGGDGYVLTRAGAMKLIGSYAKFGLFHGVDYLMFFMCLSDEVLRREPHMHPIKVRLKRYGLGTEKLRGYIYHKMLVNNGGFASVREQAQSAKT